LPVQYVKTMTKPTVLPRWVLVHSNYRQGYPCLKLESVDNSNTVLAIGVNVLLARGEAQSCTLAQVILGSKLGHFGFTTLGVVHTNGHGAQGHRHASRNSALGSVSCSHAGSEGVLAVEAQTDKANG
jgi:hypothetical protein